MITIYFAFLLVASSCGQPPNVAKILKYEFQNIGTGPYYFQYATSDGQAREEKGELKDENTEDEHMVVHGSFSFLGADGVMYSVKYTADDQGFHPEGDHIKVPPFVPWIKGAHGHHDHDNGQYHHGHHGDDGSYRPDSYKPPTRPEYDGSSISSPTLPSPPSTAAPYPASQKPSTPFQIQTKPVFQFSAAEPSGFGSQLNTASVKPALAYIPTSTANPQVDLSNSKSMPVFQLPSVVPGTPFNKPSTAYIPSSTSAPQFTVSITPKPTYIPSSNQNFGIISNNNLKRNSDQKNSSVRQARKSDNAH